MWYVLQRFSAEFVLEIIVISSCAGVNKCAVAPPLSICVYISLKACTIVSFHISGLKYNARTSKDLEIRRKLNKMTSGLDIALTFFFVIFVIIDLSVNVVLVLAIRRKRSLQTPMNLLILHLAVTDIIIGVFIIPRHILSYAIPYPNNTASDYICKFVTGGNFIWTSVTAASGFLTIIAMERLFAVVFPHKSQLRITKQRLKWLVGACWLSSLAFNLPSLLVLKYDHQHAFCMEFWPSWVNPKAYVGLAFFAGNFSVFAMYILYSVILYSLWKKNKGVSEASRTARINARKRVTKMLILMTVVHMFCRTPNYTFYTLIYFDPNATYGSIVYNFTVFLILLNSASHPFFYCWYMDNLRKQVFAMLPHFCFALCPAKLRSFNIISTGDPAGSSTGHDGKKSKGEAPLHSCTLASESETEEKRKLQMQKSKMKCYVNREVEASDSSGDRSTPVSQKKKITSQDNYTNNVKLQRHNGGKKESVDDAVIYLDEVQEHSTLQNQTSDDSSLKVCELMKQNDEHQRDKRCQKGNSAEQSLTLGEGARNIVDKGDVSNESEDSSVVIKNGDIMVNNDSPANSNIDENSEFQTKNDDDIKTPQDVIIETEAVDV